MKTVRSDAAGESQAQPLPITEYDPLVLVDQQNRLVMRMGLVALPWNQLDRSCNAAVKSFADQVTYALRAIVKAAAANSTDVFIGPNNNANFTNIPAGGEYLIEAPPGYKFDLSLWFFQSAAANQSISILYV